MRKVFFVMVMISLISFVGCTDNLEEIETLKEKNIYNVERDKIIRPGNQGSTSSNSSEKYNSQGKL